LNKEDFPHKIRVDEEIKIKRAKRIKVSLSPK